jgi:hypothetical protein
MVFQQCLDTTNVSLQLYGSNERPRTPDPLDEFIKKRKYYIRIGIRALLEEFQFLNQ